MDLAERVIGSVLGLAIGDALGAPFANRRANDVPSPVPFERGVTGPATAMARALVRSLAARGGSEPDDVVERLLAVFRTDPAAVGRQTAQVLRLVEQGTDATTAAREIWERRGPEVSAGNGSVMSCAPLGVAYAHRPERLAELAPALSRLTHADGRCATACLAVTLCVAGLVRGEDARTSARGALEAVEEDEGGEELEYLVESVGASRPVDGPDRGFVLFAAGTAFQALVRGGDAESELRRVVSLGGAADANAAVTGALLGARDGIGGLPAPWVERLDDSAAIRQEAGALAGLASTRSG
jgi:ADP-ribosyl-[dinitrogen reductase] hydrolase